MAGMLKARRLRSGFSYLFIKPSMEEFDKTGAILYQIKCEKPPIPRKNVVN